MSALAIRGFGMIGSVWILRALMVLWNYREVVGLDVRDFVVRAFGGCVVLLCYFGLALGSQ